MALDDYGVDVTGVAQPELDNESLALLKFLRDKMSSGGTYLSKLLTPHSDLLPKENAQAAQDALSQLPAGTAGQVVDMGQALQNWARGHGPIQRSPVDNSLMLKPRLYDEAGDAKQAGGGREIFDVGQGAALIASLFPSGHIAGKAAGPLARQAGAILWHGGKKFSSPEVRPLSGEGTNFQGPGFYTSENPKAGLYYQALQNAKESGSGALHRFDVPDDVLANKTANIDLPFSAQPDNVKSALARVLKAKMSQGQKETGSNADLGHLIGGAAYDENGLPLTMDEIARLRAEGIAGLSYRGRKTLAQGNSSDYGPVAQQKNYVLYDPDVLEGHIASGDPFTPGDIAHPDMVQWAHQAANNNLLDRQGLPQLFFRGTKAGSNRYQFPKVEDSGGMGADPLTTLFSKRTYMTDQAGTLGGFGNKAQPLVARGNIADLTTKEGYEELIAALESQRGILESKYAGGVAHSLDRILQDLSVTKEMPDHANYSRVEEKNIRRAIADAGFDGYRSEEVSGKRNDSLAIFDGRNIKSGINPNFSTEEFTTDPSKSFVYQTDLRRALSSAVSDGSSYQKLPPEQQKALIKAAMEGSALPAPPLPFPKPPAPAPATPSKDLFKKDIGLSDSSANKLWYAKQQLMPGSNTLSPEDTEYFSNLQNSLFPKTKEDFIKLIDAHMAPDASSEDVAHEAISHILQGTPKTDIEADSMHQALTNAYLLAYKHIPEMKAWLEKEATLPAKGDIPPVEDPSLFNSWAGITPTSQHTPEAVAMLKAFHNAVPPKDLGEFRQIIEEGLKGTASGSELSKLSEKYLHWAFSPNDPSHLNNSSSYVPGWYLDQTPLIGEPLKAMYKQYHGK